MNNQNWLAVREQIKETSKGFWQNPLHLLYLYQQDILIWNQLYELCLKSQQMLSAGPLTDSESTLLFAACSFIEVGWQLPDSPHLSVSERIDKTRYALQQDERLATMHYISDTVLEAIALLCTAANHPMSELPIDYPIDTSSSIRLRYLAVLLEFGYTLLLDRLKQLPKVNWDLQGDYLFVMRLILAQYVNFNIGRTQLTVSLRMNEKDSIYEEQIKAILLEPILAWYDKYYTWLKDDLGILLGPPNMMMEHTTWSKPLKTNTYASWVIPKLDSFVSQYSLEALRRKLDEVESKRHVDLVDMPESVVDFFIIINNSRQRQAESIEGQVEDPNPIPQLDRNIKFGFNNLKSNLSNKELIQDFGILLFELLFSPPISEHYRILRKNFRLVRIRLRIMPNDLAQLPWEFLYDEQTDEYLSCQEATPLTRFLPQAMQYVDFAPKKQTLQCLLIISNPKKYHPPLDELEWEQRMRDALVPIQMTRVPAKRSQILDMVQSNYYDIVHFVGHGDYWDGLGVLALCDENGNVDIVDEDWFSHLFSIKVPQLVCFAACHSSSSSSPYTFSGVSQKLLRRGVPSVIGMQYAVLNRTALEFFERFYLQLASKVPVDIAIQKARHFIAQQNGMDNREFGTPTLYFRARNGQLSDK